MELNLQPRALVCCVSGEPFREGDRVASLLSTSPEGAALRYDALETHAASLAPEGFLVCRWVQVYKPLPTEENRERNLKLTAENLFVTLADPSTLPSPETDRLVRFLALLLERKRLLRPRGPAPTEGKDLYEHARTKQGYEVPSIELTAEFFTAVQGQLSVLVGGAAAPEPSARPEAVANGAK